MKTREQYRALGHPFASRYDNFIGGKWKTVVLWYLRNKTLRFGELKKQIPDITEKMLSIQLKSLEEDGLIKREVFAEVPLRVEYSMTEFGKSLIPILEAVAKWGRHFGETKGSLVELKPRETKKKKQKAPKTLEEVFYA